LEALVHSGKMRPPKIQLGFWENAVSSLSGVWGRAPAEIEVGVLQAIYSLTDEIWWQQFQLLS